MEVGTVRRVDIEQTMRSAYLSYAMSVITARALPDVRDGLKPVQRRILYAMNDMGLRHDQPTRKSARIVGEVLGKYHPHGDMAVYDAMVRMAQDFAMRYVLVDGQGNFGSIDGDGAAAMRYTEARLSSLGEEMLLDLDKNTVDFVPNFDGSLQEPVVLPARVPNLLVNGVNGIAVGMATNIPPHNLAEVVDAAIHVIERYDEIDEISVDDLMRFLPGPDFPSAGTVLGMEGIRQAYATGKGRIIVRSQAHIEEMRGGHSAIIVTELPFQVNKASLVERIADLVRDGRLEGISDLRDESDRRTGMRIVIELKRGQEAAPLLAQLLKLTQMQTTFGINMLALVGGEPRVLPLKRILMHVVDHRHEVLVRRTQYELERAQARAHVLEGLIIALNNLDQVIDTIRRSRTAETAQQNLISKFKLTEIQARAILDMQLRRLAALERRKIEEEHRDVLKRIEYLRELLASKKKVLALITEELLDLKRRFGDARRTRLSNEVEDREFRPEDLLPDEDVVLSLTQSGTVLRVPVSMYRAKWAEEEGLLSLLAGGQGSGDWLQATLTAHSRDTVLFLTDQGRAFALGTHQVPDGIQQASGQPLKNLVSLAGSEKVVSVLSVEEFGGDRFISLATQSGKIKRLALSETASITSSGAQVIGLDDNDALVAAQCTGGEDELLLVTAQGKVIRFQEDTVRAQGRSALGMRGITLKEDDQVVGLTVARPRGELVLVTAEGYAKRTPLTEYGVQGRGGQGLLSVDSSKADSTGPVVAAQVVTPAEEVVISTTAGSTVRARITAIPQLDRASWGRLVTKSRRRAIIAVKKDKVAALLVLRPVDEDKVVQQEPAPTSSRRGRRTAGTAKSGEASPSPKPAAARATRTRRPRASTSKGQASSPPKDATEKSPATRRRSPAGAQKGAEGSEEPSATKAESGRRTRRTTVTRPPRRGRTPQGD